MAVTGRSSPSPCIPPTAYRGAGRGEEGPTHIWNLLSLEKTNDWSPDAGAVPTAGRSQAWVLKR